MNTTGDVTGLLLNLAWIGELSTSHIQRLSMPAQATTFTAWYALRDLKREGYTARRMWSLPRPAGDGPPVRQPTMWSLTSRGRECIHDHDQYPPRVFVPRARRMLPHDAMTSEIIVRLIELGRTADLSGVYCEREVRIDPARSRPVMDAIVILRTGGGFDHDDIVPWSKDPRLPGERRRRYAIENDRGTEPLSVIAGKARAYQEALNHDWKMRYGGFPIPLWVVPTERRRDAILHTWQTAWPGGKWLITTDAGVAADHWIEYFAGEVRERRLFEAAAAP